jgi:D-alanyl-D-alanine carboxypeptidase
LNHSSAFDICRLAGTLMRDILLRKIVSTKKYNALVTGYDGTDRKLKWTNTNRLLGHGFEGVKTGIT